MSPTSFNTENRTDRQLLGNGLTYQIPRFQREFRVIDGRQRLSRTTAGPHAVASGV